MRVCRCTGVKVAGEGSDVWAGEGGGDGNVSQTQKNPPPIPDTRTNSSSPPRTWMRQTRVRYSHEQHQPDIVVRGEVMEVVFGEANVGVGLELSGRGTGCWSWDVGVGMLGLGTLGIGRLGFFGGWWLRGKGLEVRFGCFCGEELRND